MTEPLDIAKILALVVNKVGPVEVSRELLDNMPPVRLVLDDRRETMSLRLSVLSNELLTGEVDKLSEVGLEYYLKKPTAKKSD